MNLLVLGGTIFLGRHVVAAALARGHRVTLLNRGRHGTALFPEVERLVGDRDGDMRALQGRVFDATIDCSGYTPEQVVRSTTALGDGAGHTVFVSSISAYAGFAPDRLYDETAPLAAGHEGYGALKARAEEALLAARPGQAAIVRPGLIVGPHDPTGRFDYWPRRVVRGGEVLAPGRPERPVQFIDACDLAAWCVDLAEARTAGTFNAVGPRMPMRELLEICRDVSASDARFTWLSDETLLALDVAPWTGLPLWLPESDPAFGGMLLADLSRARAAGLRTRDARATIADTLAWTPDADDLAAARPVATLSAEREAEILALPRP
ncbi:NAD-dependent epimerase/dehydratase family protein [Scleromatobacter humisilvae]|uniref:NAD-dependent epimerase/dehydratase family protein n=1 Tax=Scleromatobacter humisilvae TaxID=2897159 RepID=A0A9X1YI21_9BURK|nr:NAD-dependent epimerase/dehydratase family protein [Scleromatobacter humisilvae]MCK9685123.1 NAD-dependent epimerase/dehydratase family protein [Scleromatobacter humisilvae]